MQTDDPKSLEFNLRRLYVNYCLFPSKGTVIFHRVKPTCEREERPKSCDRNLIAYIFPAN